MALTSPMCCCCWLMTSAGVTSLASVIRPPGPRTLTPWWPPPSSWPRCTRPPPSAPRHAPPSWQVRHCHECHDCDCDDSGQYPVNTGVWPGVFTPGDDMLCLLVTSWHVMCVGDLGGLEPGVHPSVASQLRGRNYSTYHIGKWHLGTGAGGQFLPTRHGLVPILCIA